MKLKEKKSLWLRNSKDMNPLLKPAWTLESRKKTMCLNISLYKLVTIILYNKHHSWRNYYSKIRKQLIIQGPILENLNERFLRKRRSLSKVLL